ncbi:uncharacterized protein LOC124994838 isoform X2 [Sciurus carolinensis]|uniref:uncharacterized protein LOC124994838 isoform X2 n=1 Tax=Sciurus carolinensis TaxID=30640 RepID=UPI001FB4CE43|nr:uncharacterized protein LOC124994838 isoform X2 [Sciurus carolinensis]
MSKERLPPGSQTRARSGAADTCQHPLSRARPLGHLPATRGLLQPSAAPQAVSRKLTPSTQRILAPPHQGKRQRAAFGSPGPPEARPDSRHPAQQPSPAAKHDSALLLSSGERHPSASVRPAQENKMTVTSDTGRHSGCIQVRTARELGPAQPPAKGARQDGASEGWHAWLMLSKNLASWCYAAVVLSSSLLHAPYPSSLILERSPHPPFLSLSSAKAPTPCWHEPHLQGCPGHTAMAHPCFSPSALSRAWDPRVGISRFAGPQDSAPVPRECSCILFKLSLHSLQHPHSPIRAKASLCLPATGTYSVTESTASWSVSAHVPVPSGWNLNSSTHFLCRVLPVFQSPAVCTHVVAQKPVSWGRE